jgi:hypothetical protein
MLPYIYIYILFVCFCPKNKTRALIKLLLLKKDLRKKGRENFPLDFEGQVEKLLFKRRRLSKGPSNEKKSYKTYDKH